MARHGRAVEADVDLRARDGADELALRFQRISESEYKSASEWGDA